MTRWLVCLGAAVSLAVLPVAVPAQHADTKAIDGAWEGPWYRGMSSGKAKLELKDGDGAVQLVGLDNFGADPQPLKEVGFDGKALSFRVKGEGGSTLLGTLKLNEPGTDLKGMCKFEGFTVRLELKRASAQ